MRKKEKVIIRRSPDYNPEIIKEIIQKGLEEFGLTSKAKGRITIKPNVVMAHHKIAPSAFTRTEFLEGLLGALMDGKKDKLKIVLAEKSGAGLPTTRMFRRAGYYNLKKKYRIKLLPIEESRKKTVLLQKGEDIKIIVGEPYCTGGCHGIFLDWLYMFKDRKPKLWKNLLSFFIMTDFSKRSRPPFPSYLTGR